MKATKFLSILLTIILSLSIVACDVGENMNIIEEDMDMVEEDLDEITQIYEPDDGGTLKLAVTRFSTLNPLYNKNYTLFQIHHLIYEGLVTFDENMEIKPLLATDWRKSEDGQSIQFTLRNDVKWHDDTPLTAEDIIFTINLIKDNTYGTSVFQDSLKYISDVRIVENNIINITFSQPYSNALEIMTFPILPKHVFQGENMNKLQSSNFPLIGTGPFKLEKYDNMRNIKLSRNDNYWGKVPYITDVDIMIVPDVKTQLSVFEIGDIDLAQPTAIDWAKYTEKKNVNVYEYISHNYEFLGFNFKRPLLNDKNIRKAIAYGIDRHKLINNIYLGHATTVDVPIHPLESIYDVSQLTYGHNIDKAIELLNNSGYTLNNEQKLMLNENLQPLKFSLLINDDNLLREKVAFFIKEELENIGIEIEIEMVEWEEYNSRINTGNFDIVLGGWNLSYVTDLSFAFHSSNIEGSNFISYNNEKMDDLLHRAINAPNDITKESVYSQLQKHIVEELPYMSLFFKNASIVVRDKVKGEFKPSNYNLFYGIEDWFINTK